MITGNKENFDSFLEENSDHLGNVIHDLWISKDPELWKSDPYFYVRLGTIADKLGQVMFAHDILEEGLEHFPQEVRLIQLFGLSSVKCGFLLSARDLLVGLMKRGHQDEETLGILGRVYKEMWLVADKTNLQHPFLTRSRNLYLKAFLKSRGYYSGINAASLSLLLDDAESSNKLARHVLKVCSDVVKAEGRSDYWVLATIGEACLLLDRRDDALAYYKKAEKLVGKNYADLASMRRQLNLLSSVSTIAGEVLNELRIPPVIAFTGHMVDVVGRKHPRFPSSLVGRVSELIGDAIDDMEGVIGYSSGASGSDILFLEAMQARGHETNIILPFDREEFLATSVDPAGEGWRERAAVAMERAASVEQTTKGGYEGDDVLFSYANQIIMGRAILRSRFLETDPVLLAVWDGNRSKNVGGTAELIQMWENRGYPLKILDLRTISDEPVELKPARNRKRPPSSKSGANIQRETVALLFADLVGFSRLTENQVPNYMSGFLGTLSRRMKRSPFHPLYQNIWGDAIYFVFGDFEEAARCALGLRDMMRETDWAKLGLPANLSMRIGLHGGPVYRGREPFMKRENFFGYHVNQAARIEPITSPGNVYASEQFAALLTGTEAEGLECRYVGVIVLPKEFGSYPIYHIKRRNEIE